MKINKLIIAIVALSTYSILNASTDAVDAIGNATGNANANIPLAKIAAPTTQAQIAKIVAPVTESSPATAQEAQKPAIRKDVLINKQADTNKADQTNTDNKSENKTSSDNALIDEAKKIADKLPADEIAEGFTKQFDTLSQANEPKLLAEFAEVVKTSTPEQVKGILAAQLIPAIVKKPAELKEADFVRGKTNIIKFLKKAESHINDDQIKKELSSALNDISTNADAQAKS